MRLRWLEVAAIVLLSGTAFPLSTSAATPDEVTASLGRGAAYLRGQLGASRPGRDSLAALAVFKAGIPATDPGIQAVLARVLNKFTTGAYVSGSPPAEALYTAGVDATFLVEMGAEQHKEQLQLIANYIISEQKESGGWDYPLIGHGADSVGDTSVTQYACLGLWAAERAKATVPNEVWLKVLSWHSRYQATDGGFAYCPGLVAGDGQGATTLNMTVNAVGSMHIAILNLSPGYMPLKDATQKLETPTVEPPRFGVLEKLEVKVEDPSVRPPEGSVRIPESAVSAIRKAYDWVTTRYRVENTETGNKVYYYYSLERMAALVNSPTIGNHDWYQECSEFLVRAQQGSGAWQMSPYYGPEVDTAFAVLFLSRSTGKLLQRVTTPGYGEGQMVSGRGLPDDLKQMDFNGRQVVPSNKPVEPLDKLLLSLQNTGQVNLQEVQTQIVQQVQLGNREELIGNAELLAGLVKHPTVDVRRTAVWALGRSDRLDLAEHLIRALEDEDLGVMIEAQNALCWLSRKPAGFELAESPLDALAPNAGESEKQKAIGDWHKAAVLAWGDWFLKIRPYQDRGDEFESTLRLRMNTLKNAR